MSETARQESDRRTAYINDLYAIQRVEIALKGCEALTYLARTYLAYYIGLVRRGHHQIRAPIGAIIHAQWLATGYSNSTSSYHRARRELEKAGFIRVHTHRTGPDSKRSVIDLDHSRFTYWTQKRSFNVLPLRTVSDKHSQVSERHLDDVTNNFGMLHNSDPESLGFNSNKSNCRTKKQTMGSSDNIRVDPRLYTIRHVLRQTKARDWRLVGRRAEQAVEGKIKVAGLELDYWTEARWFEMSWPEREFHALKALIPALRGNKPMPKPDERVKQVLKTTLESFERPSELDEQVYKLIGRPDEQLDEEPPVEIVQAIDDDELAILKAANSRTEYKRDREREAAELAQAELAQEADKEAVD